jgi:hypothetical protein
LQISVFARHPRDEILLLASDGLWDVLSNQDATDLALRSIKRAREKGASRKAAARVAATVLTKAAVDRGSRDNITVVIIDLAPTPAGSEQQRQCGDRAAMAAAANGPQSPDSGGEQQQPASGAVADAGRPAAGAGGGGSRPSSSGSSKGAGRTGSLKSSGSGSGNPFAAAAASPFSTAATGSSELPLPSGASGSGNAVGSDVLAAVGSTTAAAAMQGPDRSGRSSAGSGRLRGSGAGCASGGSSSVFAGAAASASASVGGSSAESSVQQPAQRQDSACLLSEQLDSIDISGMGAAVGRGGGRLQSIESMAQASSAAEGSTTSSSLEEQPTIVEPPPSLVRQTSSSPFSAFQGSVPFSDGGAEAVC